MMRRRQVVLVVDDDRDTRELLRTALRMAGFEVRTAVDGATALWQLEHQAVDAVVLDLDLPVVSGLAVHEELSSRADTRRVPVVIVTGTDWRSPFPSWATMQKPISPDALVSTVRHAVSQPPA